MNISYDVIDGAFLNKITEYEFLRIPPVDRVDIIDGYMNRAVSSFKSICKYNLSKKDQHGRYFSDDFKDEDVDEIVDIISEGMLIQWMKPYVYKQELLENGLNTKDYQTYSPGELLLRVSNTYNDLRRNYTQMIRDYSFNHGDLGRLHI